MGDVGLDRLTNLVVPVGVWIDGRPDAVAQRLVVR